MGDDGAMILVVEDNPDNLKLMEWLLEDAGYRSCAASNGEEALACLGQQANIDLVLMDISLPGIDGKETTRRLRQRGCQLPVIACTAHAVQSEAAAIWDSGVDALITKPVDESLLLQTMTRLLS